MFWLKFWLLQKLSKIGLVSEPTIKWVPCDAPKGRHNFKTVYHIIHLKGMLSQCDRCGMLRYMCDDYNYRYKPIDGENWAVLDESTDKCMG